MSAIKQLLDSPITAIFIGIVIGALALSGKFSVTATQILLVAALVIAIIGLRSQPTPVILGGGAAIGGVLLLLGYWFRPDAIPSNFGTLIPLQANLVLSPSKHKIPRIQLGDSQVFFAPENEQSSWFINAEGGDLIRVESIGGALKVSAQVRDQAGNLIVELNRNEWKVAPAPNLWDRNYTGQALEVIDSRGTVVLQVRLVSDDAIKLRGTWWVTLPPPNGRVQLTLTDGQFIFTPSTRSPPVIAQIFKYPSDTHFGELK
jgi:hypothetical protein